ncbi:MAG: hypothetical protein MJD61_11085 [Proteobacteria bacterium]|nr:hypothetical protein [Pseudomonadota bacterium]
MPFERVDHRLEVPGVRGDDAGVFGACLGGNQDVSVETVLRRCGPAGSTQPGPEIRGRPPGGCRDREVAQLAPEFIQTGETAPGADPSQFRGTNRIGR